jgi:ATP-binding cassette subfamily C protein
MVQTLRDISGDIATIRPGADSPLLLEGPRQVWLMADGAVELFSTSLLQGAPAGLRRHLCTLHPGDALFCPGGEAGGEGAALLAMGSRDSVLTRIEPADMQSARLRSLLEAWMTRLATAAAMPPEPPVQADAADPDTLWRVLEHFHERLLSALIQAAEDQALQEAQRLRLRVEQDEQRLLANLKALSLSESPWDSSAGEPADTPLLSACRLVAAELSMTIVAPAAPASERRLRDPLDLIARGSGFRMRRVALRGTWWRQNNGPLLAFHREGSRPVALLQPAPAAYQLHDPASRSVQPVDAAVAAELLPFGFMFYRPFPTGPVRLRTLLRYVIDGNLKDIGSVVAVGVACGLLGLALPILTASMFDGIIPMAHTGQMLQVGLALLVAAIASALFTATQNIALQRIEGKADAAVQAALMDRLLTLPARLFRQFQVGDLTSRVLGINAIQRILSNTVNNGLLSGMVALLNLLLLFFYSSSLAFLVLGLTLLLVLVLAGINMLTVRYTQEQLMLSGRLSDKVFHCISGIAKLKTTSAESRAYVGWLELFRRSTRIRYRLSLLSGGLTVLNSVYPVLFTMAVFSLFYSQQQKLTTGQFLAFMAAFGQFTAASVSFSASLMALAPIIPIYRRAEPLLMAASEDNQDSFDPGELVGSIEVNGLCFRYHEEGPLILDNLSFQINPGEFVAVVGKSGSGKSTLLRLLLGFETYESGSIYYDSQSIEGLDLHALRRQIGTVLQNGQLMAGDIYTNIVGSNDISLDEAWEAARLAGIADEIKAMPMGMFTMLPPGATTISGGQRQRLLIARAMAVRPRIFFFDEATSALDNINQAIVGSSLQSFNATRLVIAHRLSTIMQADRILVLDQGRIVESGSYDELMARQGAFAELARRQIV